MAYDDTEYEESTQTFTGLLNGIALSLLFWGGVPLIVLTGVVLFTS